MEYRRFGRTGLSVSVMGLGSGGPSQLGQGSGVSEADAAGVVRRALDLGINLIDTAADYRESEAILGRALRGVPRERYILCTKFSPVRRARRGPGGRRRRGGGAEVRGGAAESLERSLQRLQTDAVDLFQLHGVAPRWYEQARDRFVPVARRMQEQGKLRFLGLTETFADDDHHQTLSAGLADDLWDAMMVGYNLLTPMPEAHVLPEAARKDVGILVMCAVRRAIARPEQLRQVVAGLKDEGALARDALPDEGPLDWLVKEGVPSVPRRRTSSPPGGRGSPAS